MAESLGQAVLELTTDGSKLTRGLKQAEGETHSFSSKAGGALKSFGATAGLAAGAAGVAGLTFALKTGWSEWQEHQKIAAQTEAVLKSTGGAAGVTAKHIENLAGSIMQYSGQDDEAVQAGENLLLTFTNLHNQAGKGNDIFDQSTRIMVDMSQALGQDMSSSAIQLGKALNDPIKGITALSRVGVSFTAGQKEQIKAMVAAGDTMGAQKLILAELNKEFGGSAQMYGETLPGKIDILKQKFSNAMGEMVGKGVSFIELHWDEISKTLDDVGDAFNGLMNIVRQVWAVIGPLVESNLRMMIGLFKIVADILHGDFGKAWEDIKALVSEVITGIYTMVSDFTSKALELLRNAGQYLLDGMWAGVQAGWAPIQTFFTNLYATILGYFTTAGDWLKQKGRDILQGLHDGAFWVWEHTIVLFYLDIPREIAGYFANAGEWLYNKGKDIVTGLRDGILDEWKSVATWLNNLGTRVTGEVTGAAGWLKSRGTDTIVGLKDGAVAGWEAVSGWFGALPGRIGHAVLSGASDGLGLIKQAFGKLFGWLPGWAKDILGIASPSKVFKEIGENIVHGLIQGFEGMGGKLKDKAVDLIGTPVDWVKQKVGAVGSYIGDLFTGGTGGNATGFLQLPASFSSTHPTMGLDGYPARDFFATPGTIVRAPADGTVYDEGGRPFSAGWSNGPGSAIGYTMHLRSSSGDYFLAHFGSMYAGEGSHVTKGAPLGVVGDMDAWGVQSHIHEGFHAFARGGIVTRPTFGLLGEAGPEAVIPLRGAHARNLGGPETIQLVVDGRILGEITRRENNKNNAFNGYQVPVRT